MFGVGAAIIALRKAGTNGMTPYLTNLMDWRFQAKSRWILISSCCFRQSQLKLLGISMNCPPRVIKALAKGLDNQTLSVLHR